MSGKPSSADKPAELLTHLERLPFSKWHRNLFIVALRGVMFDASGFARFSGSPPLIGREIELIPPRKFA
jgi:hypothetical protein